MNRIQFLASKLGEYIQKTKEMYKLWKEKKTEESKLAVSMACFQMINYLIDLAEEVAYKEGGTPETYSATFYILEDRGIITEEQRKACTRLVYLRNMLAHEYHTINPEDIDEIIGKVSIVEDVLEILSNAE